MGDQPTYQPVCDASNEVFRRLFHRHSSIMLLIDPATGVICDANRAATVFYGYAEDVLRGMRISDINIQPEHEVRHEMQQALRERRNYFNFRHRRADGAIRMVEVHSSAVDLSEQTLLFSIVFDVTERKLAEDLLRQASLVYQNSSEAMTIADADGNIVTINPAFTEITGYTVADVNGRSIEMLGAMREDPEKFTAMWQAVKLTGRWRGELWLSRKDGTKFLCWLSVSTIREDDGSVRSRVALFSDITRKKESEALIWRQANFDALTGLPNRSMFLDRLDQAIRKTGRSGGRVGLLFLDLDYFKEVNDTLGHGMGDRLLLQVARRLCHCVRESDTVARLGGDEFTVILDQIGDNDGIERVVHAIRRQFDEPFYLDSEQLHISASIGITVYPDDGAESGALLKNADQAMYEAKAQGRNRFSYFTVAMQQAAQARKRLVNDLRAAIAGDQFRVFYQPIVDLATGAVRKAEALVRWQHPVRGMIAPNEFIPVAEQTGLIVEIGDWVFRTAARQTAMWRANHHPAFQMSVNVSPVQFQNNGIDYEAWLSCLRGLRLPGQCIVIEITEGLLLDASPDITDQMLQFRKHGVQVALDDFGTGYSSLSYLKKFDIDYVKIDQSFVRNLTAGSDDLALCEAIIVMAHKLGMKVVAEGVETEDQRALLAASGCDFAQGYLFSRPVPAGEFEQFLRTGGK